MKQACAMILTVLLLLAVFGTGEATNLTTDQILNASFDSTNGSLKVQNGAVKSKECTVADGDATPDVAGCRVMKTSANTGATAITDLDNPVVGSFVTIIGGSATNSSTIADSGNFSLAGAFTAGLNDTLTLYVVADNNYAEVSRADN